jgi:hypothetical protein
LTSEAGRTVAAVRALPSRKLPRRVRSDQLVADGIVEHHGRERECFPDRNRLVTRILHPKHELGMSSTVRLASERSPM